MSDFIINNSSISCIDLKINNLLWPNDYSNATNNYLRISSEGLLTWQPANSIIENDISSSLNDNYYMVMNPTIGGSDVTLLPKTNNYLRVGLGSQIGGVDKLGTGLNHSPKGQITIGLTAEDTSINAGVFGSSMTDHLSLSSEELSIIGKKQTTIFPVKGDPDYNISTKSIKLGYGGLKKRENNQWTENNRVSEDLYNKSIISSKNDGIILFPEDNTNTSIGSQSGNENSKRSNSIISGKMRSHKNLTKDLDLKDNRYRMWEIETNHNSTIKNHLIEEYTIGYNKLFGVFGSNNTLTNNTENTFNETNDYYIGWNLSVLYYTQFTLSNNTTESIPCGNTLTLTPTSGNSIDIILNDTIDNSSSLLKLPHIRINPKDYTVTVKGIETNTTVSDGEGTNTITISISVSELISGGTTIEFTNGDTAIILYDVQKGSDTIVFTENTNIGINDTGLSIKGLVNNTTISGVYSSQKYSNYTVTHSGLALGTTVSSHTADETTITISEPTSNTIIKNGTLLTFTNNASTEYNIAVNGDVAIGSTSILINTPPSGVSLQNLSVIIKSITARYRETTNQERSNTITNEDNTYKYMLEQVSGTKFYLSTQNPSPYEGILYGDRRGKMTDSLKLAEYHAENGGFYIGWGIYAWGSSIFLNKNILADISSGTALTATSIDGTDTISLTTSGIATTISPNIIVLNAVPSKNLHNYILTIDGDDSSLADQTQIKVPYGIIQGYDSSDRSIQVLFNEQTFTTSNTTEYLLKSNETLSSDLLSYNNYYNGWSIYIEPNRYYDINSEPIEYKIDNHYEKYNSNTQNPWEGINGLMIDVNTIGSLGKTVSNNYFKDWIIAVYTPSDDDDDTFPQNIESTNDENNDLYRGVITLSGESTASAIPSNTTVSAHTEDTSTLTISNSTTSIIASGSNIYFADENGNILRFVISSEISSGSTSIDLTTTPTISLSGYVVSFFTNIDLTITWESDKDEPTNIDSTTRYYLTYNNSVWGNTNYKEVTYKNISGFFSSKTNYNSNPDINKGFLRTYTNTLDSQSQDRTNRVQLFTENDVETLTANSDSGVVTDFSPPSSVDNYYKGWLITMRFTNPVSGNNENVRRNVLHYDGTNKVLTLNEEILHRADDTTNNIRVRAPYILTKKIKSQDISPLENSIVKGTYITNQSSNTLNISNGLTETIPSSTLLRFTPPNAFQKNTVITSVTNHSGYSTLTISKTLVTDIQTGTIISYTSPSGSVSTATVSSQGSSVSGGRDVYITSSPSSTIVNYKIEIVDEPINILISSEAASSATSLTLSKTPPQEITGWLVSINNDMKYKLSYENFSGKMKSIHSLNASSSNINDFYKGWTIISKNIQNIRDVTDITGYTYNSNINGLLTGFPAGNVNGVVETDYLLIPSKNIKYGINGENITDNTTTFNLSSPYNEENSNSSLIENGIMTSKNILSPNASSTNDYYNGWRIEVNPTITIENNKIIFNHAGTDKVATLTVGYYDLVSLSSELETQLNNASSSSNYEVTGDQITEKLTISSSGNFYFKWTTTQNRFKSNSYELLGFNNTDSSTNVTSITSDNKISLYSIGPESSIITKYYGSSKEIVTDIFRINNNIKPLITPTNDKTVYKIIPPEHTNGTLEIDGSTIKLEENKCILDDDYYNGWTIITVCDGLKQFSYIKDYNKSTREITCPSLDATKLLEEKTKYYLSKHSHYNGKLIVNDIVRIPEEGRNNIIVDGFGNFVFGDINDNIPDEGDNILNDPSDPTTDAPPSEVSLRLDGINLSTVNDYYKGWKISIFVSGVMYVTKILRYYGSDSKIETEDFDYKLAVENTNNLEYILYEPQTIKLSNNSIPIDDFYRGWSISVKTNGIFQDSIITKYYGDTRKIIAPNLTEIIDENTSYELFEHREGLMTAEKKLSNMASYISEYYNGWFISILDSNGKISSTTEITGYNLIDKEITCSVTGTSSGTRYKLYNNSHNTSLGNNTGKKNKTGFRNISLGNNAGPTNVSDSDKLYISSNNVSRGDQSFIYGNMEEGSEELLINGSLKINGKGGLSQNGTDTKSITFPSERGNSGESLELGDNGVLSWINTSPYFIHNVYDPSSLKQGYYTVGSSYRDIFSGFEGVPDWLTNGVTFTSKKTSCMVELFIWTSSVHSNVTTYFRLADSSGNEWSVGTASGGGNDTDTIPTERYNNYSDETDNIYHRALWELIGLTVGNNYTFKPQFKFEGSSNYARYIRIGGSYPALIFRAYYT